MSRVTKTSLATATCALLLIAAFTFQIGPSHVAEAQELVNRSIARTIKITPEMRAKIEAHMKADMKATLEEARRAKDLKTITKEEFEKDFKMDGPVQTRGFKVFGSVTATGTDQIFFHKKVGGPAGAEPGIKIDPADHASLHPIKEAQTYLSYTDSKGRSVVIGLDENDTVVMKIVKISAEDMVPGPDGMIGFPAEKILQLEE